MKHEYSDRLISPPPDPDGDSQMRASSSDDDYSDAMFPTANEPAPSHPNPALSELLASPPISQDPRDQAGAGFEDDVMDFTESANADIGAEGFERFRGPAEVAGGAGDGLKPQTQIGNFGRGGEADKEKEPGYAWNSKKARDEYQRAMELVLDKKFNLSK